MSNYNKHKFTKYRPWITSAFLLPIAIFLIFNRGEFIFIDYVNLLIHEGGHGIFRFFGKLIYTFGGSFMQLALPCMFVVFYLVSVKFHKVVDAFI